MTVGTDTEIKLASDTEIKCAADNTFHFGIETGIQIAGFLKFTGGVGIDKTSMNFGLGEFDAEKAVTELKSSVAEIKNTQSASIEKISATLFKVGTKLGSVEIRVDANNLSIFT